MSAQIGYAGFMKIDNRKMGMSNGSNEAMVKRDIRNGPKVKTASLEEPFKEQGRAPSTLVMTSDFVFMILHDGREKCPIELYK